MVLIYLCIAIGCLFWQPNLVLGTGRQAETVLNMFNINNSNAMTLSNFNQSSELGQTGLFDKGNANQGNTIILTLIDGLGNALGWLILIFKAALSPIIIMVNGGFPIEIAYIVGLPLVVLFIVAVVRAIRGY